ncbi:MAG: hypothetical protein DM484_29760 [Candidatus Methylumidiphilus alinenensis]|uniref:Bro-N domain-containing protein n=1 Tax=Candidatus Methylumidiphilus alinenensis TaxID=2202197 RepID=A0A2W4QE14_9GAMM|nr:MAG: hypothetical protein DM484_29760 [Candidatus Methylumidiphilus alinenensis]
MTTPAQNPSNGLAPFEFQTHQVRVQTDENGDPWFIAMDVAAILSYKDTEAMTRRLDEDEVRNLQIVGFNNRGVNLISESGLYEAIFGSSKPEAKAFKKWVKSEVLPSIRKTGSYAAQPRPLPEPPAKESSVTRLLVTMRYGQQPITETLSPNKHVLSLNDFTELARKTGFLVISKEELNRLFGSGHEI